MKSKNIVSGALLLFVAASVVYLIASELRPGPEPSPQADALAEGTTASERSGGDAATTPPAPDEAAPAPQDTLIAYYFHGDVRCKTCLAIEAYAQEALTNAFPEEIASGRIRWEAVNFDQREHEHFLRDYELVTSSLVLVDTRGGEQRAWKTVEEVWDLVSDKPAFLAFVESEARTFLESSP
jgi:hypothetical protein